MGFFLRTLEPHQEPFQSSPFDRRRQIARQGVDQYPYVSQCLQIQST